MDKKSLWIVLIIATMVCSASCQSGEAKKGARSLSAWQKFKALRTGAITGLRNMADVLTAPKLKNRQDICVWKICSRPLKKTNSIPEVKPLETGGGLSDVKMIAILKSLENSSLVNTYSKEIIGKVLINRNSKKI